MIIAIGTDAIEVERIRRAVDHPQWGERFRLRVFTDGEIAYCLERARHAESFAARFAAFARQRSKHGRLYAHQRGADVTRVRHAIGVLGSPLVPFLMTARVFQSVFMKKRYRAQAVVALPLVFALNVVWAFAEARGHLELVTGR